MRTEENDQATSRPVLGMVPVPLAEVQWLHSEPDPPLAERVLNAVEAHVAAEADSVSAYQELASNSRDPVVSLLMRLVWDDEERHHALLKRMAARLHDELEWTSSPEALPAEAPLQTGSNGSATAESVAALRTFVREEHDGAVQLRQLAKRNAELNEGLFALLLETMAMDSEKHERILRFVLRRLESK